MRRSARTILRSSGARHIVGCITSWSRKEVIPVLEKAGGTLWYACPYEGFEANEHVVYMHACPNQHLVPLLGYVVPRFGANGFLLGSNYIWGWETNRVARDLIADAGGRVLGERYLPLGETDVSRLIAEIRATRPDFVLNNLIGHVVLRLPRGLCRRLAASDPHFRPERCPVLSLQPHRMRTAGDRRVPATATCRSGRISRDAAAAGPAVPASSLRGGGLCLGAGAGRTIAGRQPDATWTDLPGAFASASVPTRRLGDIAIDPQTQHATLPV